MCSLIVQNWGTTAIRQSALYLDRNKEAGNNKHNLPLQNNQTEGDNMRFDELRQEILRLSPEIRASLAKDLLASLDNLSDEELEKLWVDEASRRDDTLNTGIAQSFPKDEVMARARKNR